MEFGPVVKIKLDHSARIPYVVTATGEKGTMISTNGRLILMRGRMYMIPISTKEALDEHHIFKTIGKIAEVLDVRNIQDGFASIIPIVHGTPINNGDDLGVFV